MNADLHEQDFYAWTQQQTELLRNGRFRELDIANLIEEVDDMGASVWRQLESRLEVLMLHMLKWQFQSNFRGRSWQLTIKEQRLKLERLIRQNPSIKSKLVAAIVDIYPYAVVSAARETGLDETVFPTACPYTVDNLFDHGYFPG